jgi:hypothetical protein
MQEVMTFAEITVADLPRCGVAGSLLVGAT